VEEAFGGKQKSCIFDKDSKAWQTKIGIRPSYLHGQQPEQSRNGQQFGAADEET